MRVLRVLKRTLAVLFFVCMTLKIQLELRVLRAGTSTGYSPWWGNETLGHLRAFPKLATRGNVTLDVLRTTGIPDSVKKTGISYSLGDLTRGINEKSEVNSSYRKILSDVTNRSNSTDTVRSSGDGGFSTTATGSPSNVKTRADIFAKMTIYNGKNTIDTDAIYFSQKRHTINDILKQNNDKLITRISGQTETSVNKQVPIPKAIKISNSTKLPQESKKVPQGIKMPRRGISSSMLKKKVKELISKGVSHDVDQNEMSLTKEAIVSIKKELKEENEKQTVYNQEKFGPVGNDTPIFLVQVHKRLENLRYLVASLRTVKGIQEAMVVFSHDLWDPAINAFVRNITEFRVMQMFFPFSIQLYPLVFPGRDPKDCSWNTNAKGKKIDCQNANWPDSYGHYREASFTQIKHHWWWKIHRVFEGLRVTQNNYKGHVVFLEEDHYVSPDILHVLSLMQRLRPTLCPSCKVLALGNYNKLNPHIYKNLVEKGDWWVTKYNLGFAMDAAVWRSLSKCKEKFCTFDDYNWDWTMTNVAQTCLQQRLSMMSVRLTRVLHLGSCGTHVKKKVCDVQAEVKNAVSRLSASMQWLYPNILVPLGSWKSSGKPKKGNGGWGDLRDRELCRGIGNGTIDEAFLTRLQARTSV